MELTKKRLFSFVLAMSKNKGIGYKGKLPWEIPQDLKHFKNITSKIFNEIDDLDFLKGNLLQSSLEHIKISKETVVKKNMIVMGRKTWDSIPQKFRPLPGRINVVLSTNEEFFKLNPTKENEFYALKDVESVFTLADKIEGILNEIFIIGGNQIYKEFLAKYPNLCKFIFLTQIEKEFECDVFFELPKSYVPINVSKSYAHNDITYDYRILINPIHYSGIKAFRDIIQLSYLNMYPANEETQYINMIIDVMKSGVEKESRTGINTISKFGYNMRFDCSETFPLLTTKDTFWRGIVEELLWFIKGCTNAKLLQDKRVHIWDGNSSRSYLDSIGLKDREEGDLGPIYGFQWRHFGAEYKTMHDDYTNCGIDQLKGIIDEIKADSNSRRLIMSAWNVKDLKIMALPPCHILCQFYLENDRLHLQMYQRSADIALGVPFNIASYGLLLRMVSQVTGKKCGTFSHIIGDAHIYKNHLEPIQKQLKRVPRSFPILEINPEKKNIEDFTFEDFKLLNYNPYPKIKMEMAV
jgi:dihydrofolate reductase/thymidylate synthase